MKAFDRKGAKPSSCQGPWLRLVLLTVVAIGGQTQGAPAQADDELSGADRFRSLYSSEFRFTRDGLPVVPIAVAEGIVRLRIASEGGLRVLPEGEEGSEIRADGEWELSVKGGTPARIRHWSIVWRGGPTDSAQANGEAKAWKGLGENARVFEQGALFGVSGEVWDRREVLVAVGPHGTYEQAEKAIEALNKKRSTGGLRGVYTELVDLPGGTLEATGARTGARVQNRGMLWFAALGKTPVRVFDLQTSDGKKESGGEYHGLVYVAVDRQGTLAVVNAVPEDRLLAGLVPSEIFPSAPEEALKAQAVAARGHLLSKLGTRHLADPFRLCARTHCQVYAGAGKENPRTTAAVQATRGYVLFAGDGKTLADTVYSANCGGHTEHNENAWPDLPANPLLRGHMDHPVSGPGWEQGVTEAKLRQFIEAPPPAWCGQAKMGSEGRFRWTVTRSADELRGLLAPLGVGKVQDIQVLERGVSGRALAIRIVGQKRSAVVRGELRIRRTFGNLRSALFVVEVIEGAATFRGVGFGHGVGLCQTGSIGMAEAGKPYQEILRHYYPGSMLRKLW